MLLVSTQLRPSAIHGIGTFVMEAVKKSTLVWVFDSRIDRVYRENELHDLPECLQRSIKTYSTWCKSANVWVLNGDNGRHFNHSVNPSTLALDGRGGFSDIVAARDLAIGDELTSDYTTICDWTRTTGEI